MDVAENIAQAWNGGNSGNTEVAKPTDFWPICQILAAEGLLTTPEEQLATVRVGPFRLAQTSYDSATRDFIEVLVPATASAMAAGQPLHAAVAGVLTAGANTFIQLLRRGVTFGRAPEDRTRWLVLLNIAERNDKGEYPDRGDILRGLPNLAIHAGEEALDWLTAPNADTIVGKERIRLVNIRADGGHEALV